MDTNQLIISCEGTVLGTRNGWGALWRAVRSSRGLPRWMRSECSMVPEAKFYSLDDWLFEPLQPIGLHTMYFSPTDAPQRFCVDCMTRKVFAAPSSSCRGSRNVHLEIQASLPERLDPVVSRLQ